MDYFNWADQVSSHLASVENNDEMLEERAANRKLESVREKTMLKFDLKRSVNLVKVILIQMPSPIVLQL